MNLSIDIGNSNVKIAVFRANKVEKVFFLEKDSLLNKLRDVKLKYTVKAAILSTVSEFNADVFDEINKLFPTILLDINLKFPFQIEYKTKETLGVDRLALVAAAVSNYPKKNVLIIDAGTCITYDFKTKDDIYLGGAIAPGILMRYKAMHNQTANLPLLTPRQPKNNIGNSTQQSIHNGVCKGVIYEIEGVITQYMADYPNLTVVLTGGDTNFLSEMLKSSIFANPNFLFEGLNHILNHNLQE